MSAHGIHVVSRNPQILLSPSDYDYARGVSDAYKLVMARSNNAMISAEGLDWSVRVQAYLCREYNRILLKGWQP